jgi:hypothetical protein
MSRSTPLGTDDGRMSGIVRERRRETRLDLTFKE